MIFEQEVLDALEKLNQEAWEGEVWRFVARGRNPLLANRTGARWSPPGTAALYTSLERGTVLAELDHLRNLQTPPVRRSAFRLYRVRVQVESILILTNQAVLGTLGLDEQQVASDDMNACQSVGGAAAWLGRDAILVPSARADGSNLVVFVDNQQPDAVLEPVEEEDLED